MKRFSTHEKIVIGIIFAIFAIYAFTLIFPFVWCFYNSFKTNNEFFKNVWSMPNKWLFKNWKFTKVVVKFLLTLLFHLITCVPCSTLYLASIDEVI